MNLNPIPFTVDAYAQMKRDLHALLQEEKEVLERLKIAREMGDLSENGAYKYAKFELGRVRREMGRLRHLLANGQVVKNIPNGSVQFGSRVTVEVQGRTVTYLMVSQFESDPQEHKLSIESPLGQQLLGKKVGDTCTVMAPIGEMNYRIIEIA